MRSLLEELQQAVVGELRGKRELGGAPVVADRFGGDSALEVSLAGIAGLGVVVLPPVPRQVDAESSALDFSFVSIEVQLIESLARPSRLMAAAEAISCWLHQWSPPGQAFAQLALLPSNPWELRPVSKTGEPAAISLYFTTSVALS